MTLDKLERVMAFDTQTDIIRLETVMWFLNAESLNANLIWTTGLVFKQTFSSVVSKPSSYTLFTVIGDQVEVLTIDYSITTRSIA